MAQVNCLLLLGLLTSCGSEPQQQTVPTRSVPPSIAAAIVRPPAAQSESARPKPTAKVFRGIYLRTGSTSAFQPCGQATYYAVRGRADAITQLRERFRFTAVRIGWPLFAVLRGYFVDDTVGANAAGGVRVDTARVIEKRFFLVDLDTLRARRSDDCGAR